MRLKNYARDLHIPFYRFMRKQPGGKIWTASELATKFNEEIPQRDKKLKQANIHFFLKTQDRYKKEIIKVSRRIYFKLVKIK